MTNNALTTTTRFVMLISCFSLLLLIWWPHGYLGTGSKILLSIAGVISIPMLRNPICRAILGEKRFRRWVVGAKLESRQSGARIEAVEELRRTGTSEATDLLATLVMDRDPKVRWMVIRALAMAGRQEALPLLVEYLRDKHKPRRADAASLLDDLGWKPKNAQERIDRAIAATYYSDAYTMGPSAVEPLMEAFRCFEDDAIVRTEIAETIGMISDRKAIDALLVAASDRSVAVHKAAVRALARLIGLMTPEQRTDFGKLVMEQDESSSAETPLHLAVGRGDVELAKLLIEKGADINATDCQRETPLHLAVGRGDVKLAKLLIEKGADKTAAGKYGNSPLHYAFMNRACHLEAAELLLDEGVDVNAPNDRGWRALHVASGIADHRGVSLLLRRGADAAVASDDGTTPLHQSSALGHTEVMKLLLAAGARVDASDVNGFTPLTVASSRGMDEATSILRNHVGAPPPDVPPRQESAEERIDRQLQHNVANDINVGQTYTGRVIEIVDFGAFIEIAPGRDGLCHVSEIANRYVKHVVDVLTVGQVVRAKVIDMDNRGRIKLSIKRAEKGGLSQPAPIPTESHASPSYDYPRLERKAPDEAGVEAVSPETTDNIHGSAKGGDLAAVEASLNKEYANERHGFSLRYPDGWDIVFQDTYEGSWVKPVGLGGPRGEGGRPGFTVQISGLSTGGEMRTYMRNAQTDLSRMFGGINVLCAEERTMKTFPTAWMRYTYQAGVGPMEELNVTTVLGTRWFVMLQFICECPASRFDKLYPTFCAMINSMTFRNNKLRLAHVIVADVDRCAQCKQAFGASEGKHSFLDFKTRDLAVLCGKCKDK